MHDREKFISTYGKLVPSLVEKYGGEYLIVAPGARLLEGKVESCTQALGLDEGLDSRVEWFE